MTKSNIHNCQNEHWYKSETHQTPHGLINEVIEITADAVWKDVAKATKTMDTTCTHSFSSSSND